jgi:transposase
MGKRIHYLREVSETEEQQLRTLAHSRTQPHQLVQRANLIVNMIDLTASKAAKQAGFKTGVSGAYWVKRFNEDGIEGLADKLRSGKPKTHSIEVRSQLIDLALQKPRYGASHMALIEKMIDKFASDRWLIIEDNLSAHPSRDVKTALLAWSAIQIQFTPQYACWLNLIGPWWRQLKSLSLKGRRFETVDALTAALTGAVCWWNEDKPPYQRKKMPQQQPIYSLGGYGSVMEYTLNT